MVEERELNKFLQVKLLYFQLRVNNKRHQGPILYSISLRFNDILIKLDSQSIQIEGECTVVRSEKEKLFLSNIVDF